MNLLGLRYVATGPAVAAGWVWFWKTAKSNRPQPNQSVLVLGMSLGKLAIYKLRAASFSVLKRLQALQRDTCLDLLIISREIESKSRF